MIFERSLTLLTIHMPFIPQWTEKSMYVFNGLCNYLYVCMCLCAFLGDWRAWEGRGGWGYIVHKHSFRSISYSPHQQRGVSKCSFYNSQCSLVLMKSKTLLFDLRTIKIFTNFLLICWSIIIIMNDLYNYSFGTLISRLSLL